MSVALRYINREVFAVFAVALSMLLLVAVGGRFIGYLQEAATGKFTGTTVLTIIYLRLPEFVQLVSPFAAFVAVLLTLGRLYADQEMVVLQGAGASTSRLVAWIGLSVGLIAVVVAALSWWLTPLAQRELVAFMAEQRAQSEFETVNPGTFHIYDRGRRVTYTASMSDDREELEDVFLSERLDDGRQVLIWAETGRQEVDPVTETHFLVLSDGRRYEGEPGRADFRIIEFDTLKQRLEITPRPQRFKVEAQPSNALGDDAESNAEWHWRLALPVYTLLGGLLAIGGARVKPRQGRFARVVPGGATMLIYYLALLINHNALSEGQIPAFLGLWPVHGAFAALAVFQLTRVGAPVRA